MQIAERHFYREPPRFPYLDVESRARVEVTTLIISTLASRYERLKFRAISSGEDNAIQDGREGDR